MLKNPTKCLWRWSPTVGQTSSSVCLHIFVPSHIWLKYRCMWRYKQLFSLTHCPCGKLIHEKRKRCTDIQFTNCLMFELSLLWLCSYSCSWFNSICLQHVLGTGCTGGDGSCDDCWHVLLWETGREVTWIPRSGELTSHIVNQYIMSMSQCQAFIRGEQCSW